MAPGLFYLYSTYLSIISQPSRGEVPALRWIVSQDRFPARATEAPSYLEKKSQQTSFGR